MVITQDPPEAPLTAIWAVHHATQGWRACVVHWKKINYYKEKGQAAGTHPKPDYMGDIYDPKSTKKWPDNRIPNQVVEGRLLRTKFQLPPFQIDSKETGDEMAFMIDPNAKEGDLPRYKSNQLAFLCGFVSHYPPTGVGGELIKPIFRDDQCFWGYADDAKQWRVFPMYFIPHGGGVRGLSNITTYKFSGSTPQNKLMMRTAQHAPPLHFTRDTQDPTDAQGSTTDVPAPDSTTGAPVTGDQTAADPQPAAQPVAAPDGTTTDTSTIPTSTAPTAPDGTTDTNTIPTATIPALTDGTTDTNTVPTTTAPAPTGDDDAALQSFLNQPLKEDDFGAEAVQADADNQANEDDW